MGRPKKYADSGAVFEDNPRQRNPIELDMDVTMDDLMEERSLDADMLDVSPRAVALANLAPEDMAELLKEDGEFDPAQHEPRASDVDQSDDPFSESRFVICKNDGCDLRASCLRFRLRIQRDGKSKEGFFFPSDGCHVAINDPALHMRFKLDPVSTGSL